MPKIKSKSLEGWTYESWTEDFIKKQRIYRNRYTKNIS